MASFSGFLADTCAWGQDLDEQTIPQEAGLAQGSVSFEKGCYLGQELVARIDSRTADVPRKLHRVVSQTPINPGDELVHDGVHAGSITSAATNGQTWFGFATIQRKFFQQEELQVSDGQPVDVSEMSGLVV